MRPSIIRSIIGGIGVAAWLAAGTQAAGAATITYAGSTLTYTAAPGESNVLSFFVNDVPDACGTLGSPCLDVSESSLYDIAAPADACTISESGSSASCRLPAAMVINLGDGDDGVVDWNGPSRIDMGPGNDALADGNGGDDVILGGTGNDIMKGHAGNDTLDGGPGDDRLEGIPGAASDSSTAGTDTYIGGGGVDSLTYETRGEPLAISLDGVANDGVPGEGDNVDPSLRNVLGGGSDDTITGSAGGNELEGLGGNDRLLGLAGDDQLEGGLGNDELIGDAGQDILGGGDGDDLIDGGPGVDRFWGDELSACIAGLCASGQDRILARDGAAEVINCGPGTDSAVVDTIDTVFGSAGSSDQCETVDRAGPPAAGAPPAAPGAGPGTSGAPTPRVTVARVTLDRRGRFVLRLAAPGAGIVTATATTRVTRRGRTVSLGRASTVARRAGTTTLRLSPSRRARAAIRRLRRIRVAVRVTFRPASGAAATVSRRTVTVVRPRR